MRRAIALFLISSGLPACAADTDYTQQNIEQYGRCAAQARVYYAAAVLSGADDRQERLAQLIRSDPAFAADVKEGRVERDVREAIAWSTGVAENRAKAPLDLTNEYMHVCMTI